MCDCPTGRHALMRQKERFMHLLRLVADAGKTPVVVLFCLCRALTCCRRQKSRSRHQEKDCHSCATDYCVKPIFRRRKKFFSHSRKKDCAHCPSRCRVKPIFRRRKKFFSRHCGSRCRVKPIFRRRKKTYCCSCAKDCRSCAKDCRSCGHLHPTLFFICGCPGFGSFLAMVYSFLATPAHSRA